MTRSTPSFTRRALSSLAVAFVASACRSTAPAPAPGATTPASSAAPSAAARESQQAAIEKARADSARYPYTAADVRFMSGMIGHHAQAIMIAGWAPSHGASRSVQILCERIINEQGDEIRTMQQWLRDRAQPVPDAQTMGMKMSMGGTEHVMLMPGMLTDAQLAELDAARGAHFDRLFLTDMIQHHRGAVSMVKELFSTPGAGQDETVFKFASDVNVDQTTEIARMEKMLAALPPA
jgi:uncharacterized protein (DUF305 family)